MLKDLRFFCWLAAVVLASIAYADQQPAVSDQKPVNYYHDVRPLFQARCQGCHQPAKSGGRFVMTDFDRLLAEHNESKHDSNVGRLPECGCIDHVVAREL